jgi:hypothetical protein
MPFALLYHLLPACAEQETRSIIVPPGTAGPLPPDTYAFCEMFCDEPGCDCRRVLLMVMSERRPGIILAVIAYGWESRAFYQRWLRTDDPVLITDLIGPELNPGSPQSELAPALLDCFSTILLPDTAYLDRVKRHYHLFRTRIDAGEQASPAPTAPVRLPPRPHRNAPCPCGSGKKAKHCCGA